jgi:DNA-binding Xre family transcriptional regulator
MAIKVNLDLVLLQRGMTLTELSETVECQPGEILEFVPDDPIDSAG